MAGSKSGLERAIFGNGCILVSTIFWGVNYPFTKALIPEWMSAGDVSATRFIGGALLFWGASLFLHPEKLDKKSLVHAAFAGFIGLFGCIYLFVLALKYGSPIDISIIMSTPPIFLILLEVAFAHRHPSLLEYAGIVASFAGAAMVILFGSHSRHGGEDFLAGDLLAVCSSLCFAVYLFFLTKPSIIYKSVSLLRWVFLFSAIPALFLAPGFLHMPLLQCREAMPWLEIAFILFCPTFIAYLLIQPAIKAIGALMVSLYQYLTPVVAAIAAMLMGLDQPRWDQAGAMLIIVAGMILTNMGKRRERQ